MYWRLRSVFKFLFWLLSDMKIEGMENIPKEGAFILAPNHISRLDAPVLMLICPRRLYVFVADKYLKYPFFKWLLSVADPIWVRRGEADREALEKATEVLSRGDPLGLAPEGTRSLDGKMQQGKNGLVYLAAKVGVPIVPVGITGDNHIQEDFSHFRRMKIRVRIGEPLRLPKEGRLNSVEKDEATDLVMRRIAALLPPEMRGVYAEPAAQSVSV